MSQIAIGIDENTGLLYEGSMSLHGHAVWPTPFLSLAAHIGLMTSWQRGAHGSDLRNAKMVFREDFFDPVARIRRGRLYTQYTSLNPAPWYVQQHPAYAVRSQVHAPHGVIAAPDHRGYTRTALVTFISWVASADFLASQRNAVLVLGAADRVSSHTILDVERLANGEELITIRTRASLGVLPQLIEAAIPETYFTLVLEQYEKAANAAYRDDAESVVDRCREPASAALIAERALYLSPTDGNPGKDLGDLATFFTRDQFGEKGGRIILSNAARLIARLHARGKSAERVNRNYPALTEADAECALSLLGIIYRELHWAR